MLRLSQRPRAWALELDGLAKSKSLGTGTIEADNKPSSQRDKKQSALEMDIEAGDWEAVGEAAAMLSDHSMASSADTDESNRLADGLSSQGSGSVGSRGDTSAKAEELDQLIDEGDWDGVAQAAVKGDEAARTKKQETEKERATRRFKHLKKEDEALAQADIWMAIAEQSKPDSEKTDKGASKAADWAIGRSLQALMEAEAGAALQRDDFEAASDLKDEDQEEV
jgi:hypothetical protein